MATMGKRTFNTAIRLDDAYKSAPIVASPDHDRRRRWRSRARTHPVRLYEKQLAALVIILVFTAAATLFCVFMVLELAAHRGRPSPLSGPAEVKKRTATVPIDHATAKFLAYLPHSGFHNQRIALENALVLARLLNRTLLLPPVRLGSPLTYVPFDDLYEISANSSKIGLEHCAQLIHHAADLPLECDDYMSYTHASWDWLVDLSAIRREQGLLEGWNFTDAWLHDVLGIDSDKIYYLKETTRNQYSFQDFVTIDPPARKFEESIHIATLSRRPERLIQLGTLFGSSRLHLRARTTFQLRKYIREQMAFTNEHLVYAASGISEDLGGAYLGVHLRVTDGIFEWSAPENVRLAWWKLLQISFGFSNEELLDLEEELFPEEDPLEPPVIAPDLPALRSPHPPLSPLPPNATPSTAISCREPLHTARKLHVLNVPLYIATDAHNPSLNPVLWRFIRTFPCAFFLEDFAEHTRPLRALLSETDGVPVGGLLMPFLDAMVVGQAWQVVGTEQSTFSTFVTDVLWRTYHGFAIVQRG
ncbi:hypothetical protein C8Q80DRAFT_889485 [Daedaleopsis nitida]|nr:hypothetical protein C8Q80DRAFT_889485 [Daedaleopsis nitida]